MNQNGVPIFTPPQDTAPVFTPPTHSHNGPVCYHHPSEPAAGQCVRCGKYICRDCVEAYTVTAGEYANQCLCYDCCQQLVSENVTLLKKQKTKITALFITTIIGMLFGLGIGISSENAIVTIFCMLWIGSFWNWIKSAVSGWWNNPQGRSAAGFVGACIGAGLVAPFMTIKKIIDCIRFLKSTSTAIEDDTNALAQMRDYMEYTKVTLANKGVDLNTLMQEGSQLYNNSYAHTVATSGEAAADAQLRRCTTTIAENGEIIRSFAA